MSQIRPGASGAADTNASRALFFWCVGLMAVLFVVSWFLAEDFIPLIWKDQRY